KISNLKSEISNLKLLFPFHSSRFTPHVSFITNQGDGMDLTFRKMLHNLSALSDLAAETSSAHNFNEVTRASLHTLLGALAIPRGAIARYTTKPRQLKIVAAKGSTGAVGQRIAIGRDEAERLADAPTP